MTEATSSVLLRNVSVDFQHVEGGSTRALNNMCLTINSGEFLSIVGSSGSGKSTLLRIIAGLENCSEGKVDFPCGKPRIGMVFQENTLFPWMTVEQNIAYPLALRGDSRQTCKAVARSTCETVGLPASEFANKYPRELSGGERRRVAVGMALAFEADLLLLDEPSSGLDDLNKWRFQALLQELWLRKPFTVVIVTHDLEEAVFLGDRVVCLRTGRLIGDIPVPFSRPRDDDLRFNDSFGRIRQETSQLCQQGGAPALECRD